jgi:hypothetical protein
MAQYLLYNKTHLKVVFLIFKKGVPMMTKFKAMMSAALLAISFSAQATIIFNSEKGLTNTTHFENFDNGAVGSNVSEQFASNGITFDTWGKSGMALTSNSVCNNTVGGMSNQYLMMGMAYPCNKDNKKVSMVSLMFSDNVSELSWLGFNRAIGKGFTIQALYDGEIVSDIDFVNKNKFENQYVNISGSIFNELRFIENGNWTGTFGIDNMAWNVTTAVPSGEVPLPGSVALMGIGMLGLGIMRKRSNQT